MRDNMKQLIKEWDKKLKESGFVDIETRLADGTPKYDTLKGSRSGWVNDVSETSDYLDNPKESNVPSREEFYIKARRFYWTYSFKNDELRQIWGLYSEGYSAKSIGKMLKLKAARRTISRWILNLTKIMLSQPSLHDEEIGGK